MSGFAYALLVVNALACAGVVVASILAEIPTPGMALGLFAFTAANVIGAWKLLFNMSGDA